MRRSREGAWIEIRLDGYEMIHVPVAPARERGLKCPMPLYGVPGLVGRSREGAWIEISLLI